MTYIFYSRRTKFFMLLAILCFLSISSLLDYSAKTGAVSAQNEQHNFHELFQRMDEMREKDRGFIFTLEFVRPLVSDQSLWTIGDPNDQYRRSIDEIGDDYICFRERGDGADFIRCTPFSNIVSVNYISS